MPDFQASLRDSNNEVALSLSGSAIVIGDYSNYIASTQVGHLLAQFGSKVIIVRKYGETTGYVYLTATGGDALIAKPYVYTDPLVYPPIETNYTYSGDAVYEVILVTVPTWIAETSYSVGDNVINNGNIYISTANANTTTPGSMSAYWTEIWNGTTDTLYDVTVVSSAYQATEYIAVDCDLRQCFADLIYQVNCIELNVDCNDVKLCENENYRKAMRLIMILDSIQTLMDNDDIDQVVQLLNQGATICSCCNS